jgi:hypothetical protein
MSCSWQPNFPSDPMRDRLWVSIRNRWSSSSAPPDMRFRAESRLRLYAPHERKLSPSIEAAKNPVPNSSETLQLDRCLRTDTHRWCRPEALGENRLRER